MEKNNARSVEFFPVNKMKIETILIDWPTENHDYRRTGFTLLKGDLTNVTEVTQKWVYYLVPRVFPDTGDEVVRFNGGSAVADADCVWCGDGKCNNNETYNTCPNDCEKSVICGDNICDTNENCCIDCDCNIGFQCISNSCVSIYECVSNSDCNTNETCVDNKCVLVEKVYRDNNNSFSNQTLVSEVVVKEITNGTINNKTTQSFAKEGKNILQIIVDWFWSLFG